MKTWVILLSIVLATAAFGATRSGATESLTATLNQVEDDGTVSLRLEFSFAEPKAVYSWRGRIYPLLGHALKVRFERTGDQELRVEPLAQAVPKLPHPADVVVGRLHSFPDLGFRIVDQDGGPFTGCVDLVLTYDTTGSTLYEQAGLDALRLETPPLRVCRDGER